MPDLSAVGPPLSHHNAWIDRVSKHSELNPTLPENWRGHRDMHLTRVCWAC